MKGHYEFRADGQRVDVPPCRTCKHKNTLAIFEDVVAGVFIEDMQDVITFGYSGSADFEDFGKTVFLTRAEAEDARRREQDENL